MKSSDSCILSVDGGGTSLKAAFVYKNNVIKDSFFSIPVHSDGTEEEIQEAFWELGHSARLMEEKLQVKASGCAFCIPGPFDYENGRFFMHHKYEAVFGSSLKPWLFKGIGRELSICFLHDSTAFLLGACAGLSPLPETLCGVIIGTGLGFASMVEGHILENPSGGPGISIFGRPYLGKTAEDYVSKRGILRRYRELSPFLREDTEVKTIADLARGGEKEAQQVFMEMGTHLSAILLPIVMENGFQLLFLGGAISKSADLFLPALKEGLFAAPMEIRTISDSDSDYVPLRGAAQYLFSSYY